MADQKNGTDMSRRRFLKNSGYVAGGVVGGGLLGSLLGVNIGDDSQQATTSPQEQQTNHQRALMFFTRQKDFNVLSAASERIFPEDDNGPGAIGLGVPYFIDHQLAGSYGNNEKEYMQGPFYPGTDYQGYQSRLKRKEIFMEGIRALERQSNSAHNASFTELEGEQQDKILQKFENNEVNLKGVTSSDFFELLRSATIAGAYADPLYNGNDDMEGWKMKEFPGHQMSYLNQIDSEEFVEIEPQALQSQLD
ncbi:gluconate 2-dehydrogenase subunit 3 family protein [Virgibacillus xinjiangensis]|uniref:Gluconate 2-dehydrogenase subunit 3 family protein n=1 Tax=Virgibacillus xinjiangensis TaxID=393090 RepID=A0ABV7CRI6_9BACI